MSRRCELTSIGVQFGNNVSHSQRKTRRRFNPNIRSVRYNSALTGQTYSLSITAKAMRCVEKVGGFDNFMLNTAPLKMSSKAKSIRRAIVQKNVESQK